MDTQAYSHTGYNVTNYVRSAFINVRKTAEKASYDDFGRIFI